MYGRTTKNRHLYILGIINSISFSLENEGLNYTKGGCFRFFLILRSIFSDAIPWTNFAHVITEIDNKYYDIHGQVKKTNDYFRMDKEPALIKRAYRWNASKFRRIENG